VLDIPGIAAHAVDIVRYHGAGGERAMEESSKLAALLFTAVRRLPQEEQDAVLSELLSDRLEAGGQGRPPARIPGLPELLGTAPLTGVGLGLVSGASGEPGGPWQTVPVRLSAEQHERLKHWCQANSFTMAVVLRGLVARFLDEQAGRAGPQAGEEAGPAS
jgi:hypothetical protein